MPRGWGPCSASTLRRQRSAHVVPGGSAASATLGYRLFTKLGIDGRAAGFAMATQGLGSAVVLNVLLWVSLVVSIPFAGVHAIYATVAVVGMHRDHRGRRLGLRVHAGRGGARSASSARSAVACHGSPRRASSRLSVRSATHFAPCGTIATSSGSPSSGVCSTGCSTRRACGPSSPRSTPS